MTVAIIIFAASGAAASVTVLAVVVLLSWDLRWVPNPTFPGWVAKESLLLAPALAALWSTSSGTGWRGWLYGASTCWLLGIFCYAIAQVSTRRVEGIGHIRLRDRAVFIGAKYTYSKLLMWLFPVLYAALSIVCFALEARERIPAWVAWSLAYASLLHVVERLLTAAGLSDIDRWPWTEELD